MIITLGHTKGGVGKSTLTLNLAVERARSGQGVAVIDGDPRQSSLGKSIAMRSDEGSLPSIHCVPFEHGRDLRGLIDALTESCQDILIDVGGKDSHALRAALIVTEVLLLPIGPESVEIWALDDILDLVEEARKFNTFRVLAVINRAKATGRDTQEAMAIVREYPEIDLLPTPVGNRSVYGNAFGQGRGVSEFRPRNIKAITEIQSLARALFADEHAV